MIFNINVLYLYNLDLLKIYACEQFITNEDIKEYTFV